MEFIYMILSSTPLRRKKCCFPLTALVLLCAAGSTYAETSCPTSEFIIETTTNPALTKKMLEAAEELAGEKMQVEDVIPQATLVTADDDESKKDLCQEMRKTARSERRNRLRAMEETGVPQLPVRIPTCSCNYERKVIGTVNDPRYSSQWGLNQANDIDVDAPEAWAAFGLSSSTPVVAVIDTGVDMWHQDLYSSMWQNPSEIPDNNIDDDNNGYIDDVFGINAITSSGNPRDDHGHGTHCAGVIGAEQNNNEGIAGVAPKVKMMALKFLSAQGSGSDFDAVEAIDYVIAQKQRGVNVVAMSNSWGGAGYSSAISNAVERAKQAGILFIAAAGNDSKDTDVNPNYPSALSHDNIISVAAISSNGSLASFSNWGATTVDVGAPGVSIMSTYLNGGYASMSGTSMATPLVSGIIAAMYALNPAIGYDQARALLLGTTSPLASLIGKSQTGGLVNLYGALAAVAQIAPTPQPTSTPSSSPTPAATATPSRTPTPGATPTPAPSATATPIPRYTLSGTVFLTRSNYIVAASGVTVEMQLPNGTYYGVAVTDSNGKFTFPSVERNLLFTVSVSGAGVSQSGSSFSGPISVNTSIVLFVKSLPISIKASSLTPSGEAVTGIPLTLRLENGTQYSCITNTSGECLWENLPYGSRYSVYADSNTHSFEQESLSGELLYSATRVFIARADDIPTN